MADMEYRAREKKVNRMTRDGLVEDNLATGQRKDVSHKLKDADFRKNSNDMVFDRSHHDMHSTASETKKTKVHRTPDVTQEYTENHDADNKDSGNYSNDTEQNAAQNFGQEQSIYHETENFQFERKSVTGNGDNYKGSHKKSMYRRETFHRQNRYKNTESVERTEESNTSGNGQKLQFEKAESDTPKKNYSKKLENLEKRKTHYEEKLEKAKRKLPKQHSIKVERVFDEEKKKPKVKLRFEEEAKQQGKKAIPGAANTTRAVKAESVNYLHMKVSQVEKDNSGVEAAHKTEQFAESTGSRMLHAGSSREQKLRKQVSRLERKTTTANTNYLYQKYLEDNPKMAKKNILNKFYQKQRIKREYLKAKSGGKAVAGAKKVSELGTAVARKIQELAAKHGAVILSVAALGLLLILIMAGMSSCGAMFAGMSSETFSGTWLSDPDEIDAVELEFTNKEAALQDEIDNIETTHSGYDEYNYNLGEIGHDPFTLISYLSAVYSEFTYSDVETEIQSLFDAMYTLTSTSRTETRTRYEGTEDEEEYTVSILDVKLTVTSLDTVIASRMDEDQKEMYDSYMDTKGGLQLFGSPVELYWYYYISSYYGYQKNASTGNVEFHKGIDIAVPEGTQVYASQNGNVTAVTTATGYGKYIEITNSEGYTSKYAHLSETSVAVGDTVTIGQAIGKSGSTGSSTGSQLYIELLYNGVYYNPLFYLNVGEGTLYGETPGGGTGAPGDGVPPESYDDVTVQTLFDEAERYLGMPYTFGGTPPTSFDCSGFVCWVFTNSGVHDLPRTTAQGIYNQCTAISASEAKVGDLIFFQGTYDTGDGRVVTHVGIYCGNGVMIHCGDPIKYSSINTSYWQSHFYGYGRLN